MRPSWKRIFMVLLTHKTEPNLSTGMCAPENGAGRLKAFGFGADLRLFAESLVKTSEPCSPVHSIVRKRMKRIVQAGVSLRYPAFCTVTASGSIRRPAAGSFFCFGFHPTTQKPRSGDPGLAPPYGLRFPSATDPPQMQNFGLGSRTHSLGFA